MTRRAGFFFIFEPSDILNLDNIQEMRATIINLFNSLEHELGWVLLNHFEPKNEEGFMKNLMHNSIVHYGGKIKALRGLNLIEKNTANDLFRLGAIRNTFAHSMAKPKEGTNYLSDKNLELTVMRSDGKLDTKQFHEFAQEYVELHNKVFERLFFTE